MSFTKISFIGGGRICWLLIKALQNKNALPQTIVVTDPDDNVLQKVKAIAPDHISCTKKNTDALDADVIFLAVHPPVMKEVLPELQGKIPEKAILVSLAPVIKMSKLGETLGCNRIARTIPNAPSLLGVGYNPVAFSPDISGTDQKDLLALFSHWGAAPAVDECKLEAYALVTAMGPTYFWFQWQELAQLGQGFGLTTEELKNAIPAMLNGAIAAMYNSGLSHAEVGDLIPVHPLKNHYAAISEMYVETLGQLHMKLTAG